VLDLGFIIKSTTIIKNKVYKILIWEVSQRM